MLTFLVYCVSESRSAFSFLASEHIY